MMKIYTTPFLDVVEFNASNVITTSETVPLGDEVATIQTDAPRRKGIWDE